jgi:exodeoxyribonuclease V alpha subunit
MSKAAGSVEKGETVLEGVLEKVIFHNENNNYTVARLKVEDKIEPVTIVGPLSSPILGEILRLRGEWVIDARFGEQFRINTCLSVLPCTVAGIEKYLGSGLIRGIGRVMARRLVEKFGLKTLDIIDRSPSRLSEVEGIGPFRIQQIVQSWTQQKDIREVMVFLEGQGISPTYAARIFKTYGPESITVLQENPYRLAMDISGIGFLTADKIAQNLGISPSSQIRAEACIIHTLNELAGDGHTFFPYDALGRKVKTLLRTDKTLFDSALESLEEQKRIVIEKQTDLLAIYLAPLYEAEVNVAEGLITISRTPRQNYNINTDEIIQQVWGLSGIELADMQIEALKKVLRNKVLIITGGPGTGKTTLMNSLIKILSSKRQKIILTSPTGRAAKRLSEVTGREATTIHRLLEYNPEDGKFKRNPYNPLEADLVIVDEVSMIDIILMSNLLQAITPETSLVMIGDADQLPAVGPGNVLQDMIDSGIIETVKLDKIFRQSQQSLIVVNAHRINDGKFPVTRVMKGPKSDFYFIENNQPESTLDIIKELCLQRLPNAFNLDPFDEIQVISPMYKGLLGVDNLNIELQNLLNPQKESIMRQGRLYRLYDKVMQTRNNYEKEVYNGDIGRIQQIDFDEQRLLIKFYDRLIDYSFEDLDEVTLAYAITVHKSQGSEYPAVILPVHSQHYIMLQRNLLYTAVTRARRLVILIGSKQAVAMAVRNNRFQKRYSGLKERLASYTAEN